MLTKESRRSQDYARATAAIIKAMPIERAAQVYDFARFLQAQPTGPSPIAEDPDAWLNDGEEQMQAEDAAWDAAYARHGCRCSGRARSRSRPGTTAKVVPFSPDKCTHSVALNRAAGFPDELERRPVRMLRSFEPPELKAQFRELALQLMARVTSGERRTA